MSEIDRLVGKSGRSEFLAQAVEKDLRRLQQIRALENVGELWRDKDHPELKAGVARWLTELLRKVNYDEHRTGIHQPWPHPPNLKIGQKLARGFREGPLNR